MVWFITVIAFKSVGFCRNNYFKIISNAPSNLICNIWKFIFHSLLQFFDVLSNDITLKGLFLHNCVVFSLFCVAIVIFEPVFERAYFGTDFVTVCQITLCPTFSGTFHRFFFFSFFFFNWKWNFGAGESANSKRRTKQVCQHAAGRNWRYYNVSRDENPKRENEMDSPSF